MPSLNTKKLITKIIHLNAKSRMDIFLAIFVNFPFDTSMTDVVYNSKIKGVKNHSIAIPFNPMVWIRKISMKLFK